MSAEGGFCAFRVSPAGRPEGGGNASSAPQRLCVRRLGVGSRRVAEGTLSYRPRRTRAAETADLLFFAILGAGNLCGGRRCGTLPTFLPDGGCAVGRRGRVFKVRNRMEL